MPIRPPNPADPVATAIRDAIKASGLTKARLASQIGVSSNTITNWTSGRFRPSAEHAPLLAESLNLRLELVLGQDGSTPATPALRPRSGATEDIVARLAAIDPQPASRALAPVLDQLEKVLSDAKRYVAASPDRD